MTNPSTLSGPDLSVKVAELRGWHWDHPPGYFAPRWFNHGGKPQCAVGDYRPDRDIGQAMELIGDNTHWASASLLESSTGPFGAHFSLQFCGGEGGTHRAMAWGNTPAEALARAICEAWVMAMEKAKGD